MDYALNGKISSEVTYLSNDIDGDPSIFGPLLQKLR